MRLGPRVLCLVFLGGLSVIARPPGVSAEDLGAADLTIRVGRSASVRTSLAPEPAASWRNGTGGALLTFDGTVATANAQPRLRWVLLDGGLDLWRARAFGMRVIAGATHEPGVNTGAGDQLRTQALFTWSARSAGLWLSGAVARPFGATNLGDRWAQGGGIWFHKGSVSVAGTIDRTLTRLREQILERVVYSPIDTVLPRYEAVSHERDVASTEVRLAMNVTQARLEINPTAGLFHVPAHGARGWIRTDASYWVSPRLALAARISSASVSADNSLTDSGLNFTLGARLAPWRKPVGLVPAHQEKTKIEHWEIRREGDGGHLLRIIAPGVRRVDLQADVTDWQVVSLEREDGDSWRVRVEGGPGPHHALVRLDAGPWLLLPDAPTQEDGYRGFVSVLIFE